MSIPRYISNNDDIIDSRDVIERIDYLDSLYDDPDYLRSEDEYREVKALRDLAEQGENDAEDWLYGATLIRESYFTEYAREYVTEIYGESVGNVPDWVVVDWEATADNLATDYTELTFDGVTYLVRG